MAKAWTHADWSPELSAEIEKYVVEVRKYGFITDHDEVFYELGKVMLVMTHKTTSDKVDNMLALTFQTKFQEMPFRIRKKELARLGGMYAAYFKARKERKASTHSRKEAPARGGQESKDRQDRQTDHSRSKGKRH